MEAVISGDEPRMMVVPHINGWIKERQKETEGHHCMNAWECRSCGKYTVTKDIHVGVTPMFLRCRATEGCGELAMSLGYPSNEPPQKFKDALAWEWYRPSQEEFDAMKDPDEQEYVMSGGLMIREIQEQNK